MTTPRISLVAYEDRDPLLVFVAIPTEPGRYVRTHRCVVEVSCPYESSYSGRCDAAVGEPCRNPRTGRYWAGTHGDRRSAANERHRGMRPRPRVTWLEEGHFA